ncbi:hybrid sensor histidine kinase/response regulator transcription factor [Prevotella sp. 10(H)]|uniref:hybrid sensor histidine kinase/response regulator transcription factor n=1 Tax=Prevotella sp. 10(H) TaxID=1158294 RepID=UPI0004A72FE9|nr:hybrid sensor histidine kinase/response regulator transcription factor [Prevotella sp. 10(H)]
MKRLSIFCLILSIFAGTLHAQQFFFKKYQVEDGLSHNSVWCTLQDSYGFMWFGTSDGLNRFDGRKFKIYRNDIQDKFSLGNNSVQALYEDRNKDIWVGTSSGIYIYERQTDKFRRFENKTQYGVSISAEVKRIIRTGKGVIRIATLGQGIFSYDPESGTLVQESRYTSFVWDIAEDNALNIYSSSLQEGLICYDREGKYVESFTFSPDKNDFSSLKINCIQVVGDKIWFSIGTNNLGLLNNNTKQVTYYNNNQNIGTIRAISQFSEWELLIGSDNGLYIFNIQHGDFTRVDNPLDSRSLSDQSIYSIVKDAEGGFWISTYLGGVNYLPQQTKVFEYYSPTSDANLSTGKVISQFCEDKYRNIWVGSQDGLKFLSIGNQQLEPFLLPLKVQKLDIRSLLLDGDNLWIGTYSEGLKVYNVNTKRLTEYYHSRESSATICSDEVQSLFKDSKNDIYVGTSWGLCRYKPESDIFETLTFVGSMTSVSDITEDHNKHIWVATYNSGVFRFNPQTNEWKHFTRHEKNPQSITSNAVITLFTDSKGIVWFGTNGGGLSYFNEQEQTFIDFDPQNEILPNKVIYSIEEDNQANLWISSNGGLLRVNPNDPSDRKLFTQEDGLQSNQFNFKASLKASTGKLYFGGINGFNAFYPNEFRENNYVPPVYLVDIRLYNTDESESRKLLNLSEPVYLAKQISLPYDNNSIVLEFGALSYEEPNRNRYMYTLEGFDRDWVNSGNSNAASYTNLPPGEYTFRVRGANNDNKWNEQGTSLKITVLPPWWRSAYAYTFYALCFLALLYFFSRYFVQKSKKELRRQMDEYRIAKEKEVYQSKISFFINLVHEIRTPLSLIKLPLDKLTEKNYQDDKTSKYLHAIDKNVNYLLNVVNQLLDFQKLENQNNTLTLREENINTLLHEIYMQFVHPAELKHIAMSITLPSDEVITLVDKGKITKIITNLLSNAVKFANTKIEVSLEVSNNSFRISVIDDGKGIPDNEKEKVFAAFYQSEEVSKTSEGTGIGLAFSRMLAENHNGTLSLEDSQYGGSCFMLSIPVLYAQLNDSETQVAEIIESDTEEIIEETDATFKDFRILLVEDNTELLNMIEDSLKPYFTILKSSNGRQALDTLSSESVDLIVSDVMMPEMDGFELCKTVKSDINYSHIPVILLTAKVTLEAKIEGLEYGADVYLEKPFSIRQLRKQIENLLKLRISLRKLLGESTSSAAIDISMPKKDREFMEKLHTEIMNHITEPDFSIDIIAETMFMSRSSFYRKIKSVTGMSPNDYLKVFRLNRAAELLLQGDMSISEICDAVAFNSSSYFAKCFKAQFGVVPKDYTGEKLIEN